MTPYEELNEKIQTLKDVLKEGIEHVNVQIKTFNEQEQKNVHYKLKNFSISTKLHIMRHNGYLLISSLQKQKFSN